MYSIVGALAASVPPHIVHIMADDTGWNDLGYKNGLIDSPNLDRLAMEGIRLTRHHSFKVCSPSRSSFHTGRYAFSLGLYDNSPAAVPWLPAFNAQVCTSHCVPNCCFAPVGIARAASAETPFYPTAASMHAPINGLGRRARVAVALLHSCSVATPLPLAYLQHRPLTTLPRFCTHAPRRRFLKISRCCLSC